MTQKAKINRASSKGVVLGRAAAAKINAVEGVSLTPEMRQIFRSFDAQRLSADERRRRLIQRFGKKAG